MKTESPMQTMMFMK